MAEGVENDDKDIGGTCEPPEEMALQFMKARDRLLRLLSDADGLEKEIVLTRGGSPIRCGIEHIQPMISITFDDIRVLGVDEESGRLTICRAGLEKYPTVNLSPEVYPERKDAALIQAGMNALHKVLDRLEGHGAAEDAEVEDVRDDIQVAVRCSKWVTFPGTPDFERIVGPLQRCMGIAHTMKGTYQESGNVGNSSRVTILREENGHCRTYDIFLYPTSSGKNAKPNRIISILVYRGESTHVFAGPDKTNQTRVPTEEAQKLIGDIMGSFRMVSSSTI